MMNVIIVGAGASGMMAAINIKKSNKNIDVKILEHQDKAGRKLLATGNGRCNLTNKKMNIECFRSHDLDRIESWLKKCDTDRVIDFFGELGMICTDKNGYVYPNSYQASTVNDTLIMACKEYGVEILYDVHVIDAQKTLEGKYEILSSVGYEEDNIRKKKRVTYTADVLVLATGSKAYSVLGSDGSGYGIAKNLGLKMYPSVPALTSLKCKETVYKKGAGVRCQAKIELYVDHERMAEDTGELQLTEYGISGIPVFQVSRYASYGLNDGCKVHVNIDFMPDYTEEQVESFFNSRKDVSIYRVLCGMLNSKLVSMLLAYLRIDEGIRVSALTNKEFVDVLKAVKSFYSVVIETNDFSQAQVCAGGIKLSEVDDTFQTVKYPDLYITGELLDVDGICGGYNLHWAWLTGIIVGTAIGDK